MSPITFREMHAPGQFLILPNAWDAASARLIEESGASAIATTSSGVAWARGYPDGNALPLDVVVGAVAEIARVIHIPLSADVEAGYSSEPSRVAELVAEVARAGAVGINLEDGTDPPDLLCAKIEAVKTAASRVGVDLFVNARIDVYLKGLVPREQALDETLARAGRYRAAGCDGIFVPFGRAADIRATAAAVAPLPLNVLAMPGLPAAAELHALGVRRLSAGSGIAQTALRAAQRAAKAFLADGDSAAVQGAGVSNAEMNGLMKRQ